MADKTLPVLTMIRAWDERDIDLMMDQFADDIVFENMPMPPIVGKDAVRAANLSFMEQIEGAPWNVIAIHAAPDGLILTERDDIFILKGGRRVHCPVMGVFKVDGDNRITLWRDYFDLAYWNRQLGLDPDFGRAAPADRG